MKSIMYGMSLALLLLPPSLQAQNVRPACALMSALDLKPILGPDHGAPAPYADRACLAKSKTSGRLVMLTLLEKSPDELKSDMAAFRKTMKSAEYAKAVSLAMMPEFGQDAFSVREKGEQSAAEIHALKGSNAIEVMINWSGPITEPVYKQLRELTASALAKLP